MANFMLEPVGAVTMLGAGDGNRTDHQTSGLPAATGLAGDRPATARRPPDSGSSGKEDVLELGVGIAPECLAHDLAVMLVVLARRCQMAHRDLVAEEL
jgi:hypothetical protein